MENICDLNKCTGCSACYNACPKHCIEMKEDEYGFLRPYINEEMCIHCNLCRKTCPANHDSEMNKAEECFAVWNLDEEDRVHSASGGIATVLARKVIEKGGVVFGCIVDDNLNIVHDCIKDQQGIEKLKGSKYVQSYIGDTYKSVKEALREDKDVIFFGTPCQVDGLKFYLAKPYEKLVTVDLICHGVPAQKYLRDHMNKIIRKLDKKVDKVTFRGENNYMLTLFSEGKIVYRKDRDVDLYFKGFMNKLYLRESCYSCRYSRPERVSDLTVGDFWGLGREKGFDRRGVSRISVALPNTKKGLDFFDECKDNVFYEKREAEEAFKGNGNLRNPSVRHKDNEKFKELYVKYGFEKAAKSCLGREICRRKLSNIKNGTKNKIKALLGISK